MLPEQLITEVIARRKSVRTYSGEEIPLLLRREIDRFVKEARGPFGRGVRVVPVEPVSGGTVQKLGTYGIIRNASYFLAGVIPNDEKESLWDLGYAMEECLLRCVSLGLSTCWLGGTFSRSSFGRAAQLKQGESLPAVSPVGVAAARPSAAEKLMRAVSRAENRKKWEELFFNPDGTPLTRGEAGRFEKALEMVRLAPSAMNAQPWRVVKEGGVFRFYCALPGAGHALDLGIALCHFALTLKEQGLPGRIARKPLPFQKYEYVATFSPD